MSIRSRFFVKPLGAEFGWSREATSSGFAIGAVTVGLCSPLLGRWIDRFGPRRIILPCMTVFGCGIASLALLRSGIWEFYVTCFVLGVVGNGAAHLAFRGRFLHGFKDAWGWPWLL